MIETALPSRGSRRSPPNARKKILFVLPNNNEYGGLEKHLLQLMERLLGPGVELSIICFGPDIFTERFDPAWAPRVTVHSVTEPETLLAWMKLFWEARPDVVEY